MIAPNTTGDRLIPVLEAAGFKQTGPNEWRGNSPLRPGSDSGAFSVRIEDDGEHGAYNDHAKGDSGSLYDIAERLGVEITRAQAQETKRAYTSLADYAAAHYAPEQAFADAGWKLGTHKGRPCFIYKVGGKDRYRYTDGKTPPYEWERGGKPAWYGLKRAAERAADKALILCNGEASTISAQHHGLAACAWAGGEQRLPDQAITELKAVYTGPVVLAYDCDSTGQRVAREVADQLEAAGYAVRVADLGLTTGGDLADFCGLHQDQAWPELDRRATALVPSVAKLAEDAQALTEQAKTVHADPVADMLKAAERIEAQVERVKETLAPPRVLELHELAEQALNPAAVTRRWPVLPIPELAALVGPLEPELYVIYGAPNMGKSWLASTVAASLVRTGSGLIITTETKPQKFFERMVSYACKVSLVRMADATATDAERAAWRKAAAAMTGYETRLMDLSSPSGRQVEREAKRAKKEIGLDWLIVDSATRMRGLGEGIYERASHVANTLQDIARDFDIPVIVTSQVGRDVGNRPAGQHQPRMEDAYGSGVIEQNAGVVLGLYRHDYYVTRGTDNPDPVAYPPDTARLILLKHRNRPIPAEPWVTVRAELGCGFYQYRTQRIDLSQYDEPKGGK